jgi:hypothetical protein
MEKRTYRIRTYKTGDEEQIAAIHPSMHAIHNDRDLGVEYWTWKNKLSPKLLKQLICSSDLITDDVA